MAGTEKHIIENKINRIHFDKNILSSSTQTPSVNYVNYVECFAMCVARNIKPLQFILVFYNPKNLVKNRNLTVRCDYISSIKPPKYFDFNFFLINLHS